MGLHPIRSVREVVSGLKPLAAGWATEAAGAALGGALQSHGGAVAPACGNRGVGLHDLREGMCDVAAVPGRAGLSCGFDEQ